VTVPGPPVPKERAIPIVRGGRLVKQITPPRTRAYMARVLLFTEQALSAAGLQRTWPRGQLYVVECDIFRARAGAGDVDNYEKAVLDAIRVRVFGDDSKVVESPTRLHVDRENPRAVFQVECFYRRRVSR
jgi:hypothetical protein